jgi:hypothetical protein
MVVGVSVPVRPARRLALATALLAAAALGAGASGCSLVLEEEEVAATVVSPTAPLRQGPPAPPPGSRPDRVSPLADRRGLHPGLTRVAEAEKPVARRRIATVPVGPRGSSVGYDREFHFGTAWKDDVDTTWGHDGCPTREQILHRDVKGLEFRAGTDECVVLTGILQEPYTGRTIQFTKARPSEVQIDHVIPLSYAWHQGARRWSQAKREQLANDPLNLLAVDGPANQRKSGSGPAGWTPPARGVRCAYAVRFGLVALKYTLPVTQADRRAMLRACRS